MNPRVKEVKWICIDNKGYEEELHINKSYVEIKSSYADKFCIVIKNELGMIVLFLHYLLIVKI
jgi:hypothetical protein